MSMHVVAPANWAPTPAGLSVELLTRIGCAVTGAGHGPVGGGAFEEATQNLLSAITMRSYGFVHLLALYQTPFVLGGSITAVLELYPGGKVPAERFCGTYPGVLFIP